MNDIVRPEIDPQLFRRVMGRFATGVTVITALHDGEVRGMTANAFMSGSLEPPLCVVSIAKRARMHQVMSAANEFGVNILAEDQAALSEHFAGKPNPELGIAFEPVGRVMLLTRAAARMAAEVEARHDCGDHTLFVGRILHMDGNDRPPLLYHASRYRAFEGKRAEGDAIDVPEFW